ncbi:helix-turn-helix domain-containing protein [Levilactobacillus spicheri]
MDWNLTFFGAHEQAVADDWTVPIEKHFAFECIYVVTGTEHLRIQHHDYDLAQGDFFLIPPEFIHQAWAEHDLTYFCFHFDLDDPNLKAQLIQGLTYHYPAQSPLCKRIAPHFDRLDGLTHQENFDFNTKMTIQIELSKILQIFYNASRTVTKNGSSPTAIEYSRVIADYLKDALTNQVLGYVKNGYTQPETGLVQAAISTVGISDGYGFRIFKQTYGISPREYLTKLKVNEAKKLLLKPQYPIGDIGSALGYTNLANFSRQFHRWTGMSPKQWQKQHTPNN